MSILIAAVASALNVAVSASVLPLAAPEPSKTVLPTNWTKDDRAEYARLQLHATTPAEMRRLSRFEAQRGVFQDLRRSVAYCSSRQRCSRGVQLLTRCQMARWRDLPRPACLERGLCELTVAIKRFEAWYDHPRCGAVLRRFSESKGRAIRARPFRGRSAGAE